MKTSTIHYAMAIGAALLLASNLLADDKIIGLAVYPPDISLTTKADHAADSSSWPPAMTASRST